MSPEQKASRRSSRAAEKAERFAALPQARIGVPGKFYLEIKGNYIHDSH